MVHHKSGEIKNKSFYCRCCGERVFTKNPKPYKCNDCGHYVCSSCNINGNCMDCINESLAMSLYDSDITLSHNIKC
jgi:hypothetical protein